jgi:hypothetical protein
MAGSRIGILIAALALLLVCALPIPVAVAQQPTVRLVAGGDIAVTTDITAAVEAGTFDPFAELAGIYARADLGFANLESALAAPEHRRKIPSGYFPLLCGTPKFAAILQHAGVNAVSVANNHIFDVEPAGLKQSLDTLRQAQIAPIGAGMTEQEALTPHIRTIHGLRVGLIAFAEFTNRTAHGGGYVAKWSQAKDAVRALRPQVDVAVVSIHWGEQWVNAANANQVALGHQLVEAGADIVLGHHSHSIQPVEIYRGRPIFYSFGNFIWGRQVMPRELTFLAEMELANASPPVKSIRLHAVVKRPPLGLPKVVTGQDARHIHGLLTGGSLRYRTRMAVRDGVLEVILP